MLKIILGVAAGIVLGFYIIWLFFTKDIRKEQRRQIKKEKRDMKELHRLIKVVNEKERLSQMTKEQIQEEEQIKAETKYILVVCSIVLLIIILIAIFK